MGFRTPKIYIDNEGAVCLKLFNRTGGATVAGTIVKADTGNGDSVIVSAIDDPMPIGFLRDTGVADGSETWVQIAGRVLVLGDSGGVLPGQWCGTGPTAGSVDGDTTIPAATQHFQEIGHSLSTIGSGGTGRIVTHFN